MAEASRAEEPLQQGNVFFFNHKQVRFYSVITTCVSSIHCVFCCVRLIISLLTECCTHCAHTRYPPAITLDKGSDAGAWCAGVTQRRCNKNNGYKRGDQKSNYPSTKWWHSMQQQRQPYEHRDCIVFYKHIHWCQMFILLINYPLLAEQAKWISNWI